MKPPLIEYPTSECCNSPIDGEPCSEIIRVEEYFNEVIDVDGRREEERE